MEGQGKLVCSFPGPAIAIALDTFQNKCFQRELASFLMHMNSDVLDSAPMTRKAQTNVREIRDAARPVYITQLLTGILRGAGGEDSVENVHRFSKRIMDTVLYCKGLLPWRRSQVWLVLRVALQIVLFTDNDREYKSFLAFFAADVLSRALKHQYERDTLFSMKAKVVRKIIKLDSLAPDFVTQKVKDTITAVQQELEARWTRLQQAQSRSSHWAPEELDVISDSRIFLPKARGYIMKVLNEPLPTTSSSMFIPPKLYRLTDLFMSAPYGKAKLVEAFSTNTFIALVDFEHAVERNIHNWTLKAIKDRDEQAAEIILMYAETYHSYAKTEYASNPEDWSLMLLCLLEMWVAMDQLTVAQYPLLKEHHPQIPQDLIETLLLRHSRDIERVLRIRQYIDARARMSIYVNGIFDQNASASAFAVQFYADSEKLRRLKTKIEKHARKERNSRIALMHEENKRYHGLRAKADALYCTYPHNKKSCKKCLYEKEADSMRIAVHEWPLPEGDLTAKMVVFELQCPFAFARWRCLTYLILHDICTPAVLHRSKAQTHTSLAKYKGLLNWFTSSSQRRITLASSTKSFTACHYAKISFPATESKLCVNNGLNWNLYDGVMNIWATGSFSCDITKQCTLMPTSPQYKNLGSYVKSTTHMSNGAIAEQATCCRDITLHAYQSFTHLRSGGQLQWINICRELVETTMKFDDDVVDLFLMAAWQVGPSEGKSLIWHQELRVVEFGRRLAEGLRRLLVSVQDNWKQVPTVQLVILLSLRLLSSAEDAEVVNACLSLLKDARQTTQKWVYQLVEHLKNCSPDAVIESQRRLVAMAATCRASYDVGERHITRLLVTDDDIMTFIKCGIMIHDNTIGIAHVGGQKRLLARDSRVAVRWQGRLTNLLTSNSRGFDNGVRTVWSNFTSGTDDWSPLRYDNHHWITTQTVPKDKRHRSQSVHLNLLNGHLLIDGRQIGRLPAEIVNHELYIRTFGKVSTSLL
jgi:hypothetical protein